MTKPEAFSNTALLSGRCALTAARTSLDETSLTPRQAALASATGLSSYQGCSLALLTELSTNHRAPGDTRGLGA